MRKILLILCMLFASTITYADVLDDCLKEIVANETVWQNSLFNKENGVFSFLDDKDELTDDVVQNNKTKIYSVIARNIEALCTEKLAQIAKVNGRKTIYFKHNDEIYGFDFDIKTIFNYINEIRTGILVINKNNLSAGDVLELKNIPRKEKFFSKECSDWNIWNNLDDDAAVNIAGQATFNEFGGSQNEFFLDFADGDNRRAFPGLVLMDETGSSTEKIVSYVNPSVGLEKAQQFANALQGGPCSNQRLAVYLVALDVKKDSSGNAQDKWSIGLLSTGGAVGAGTAAVAIWAGAAVAAWVPVVGWIAAGALVATGTVVALVPKTIEKIDTVMILDGPYAL